MERMPGKLAQRPRKLVAKLNQHMLRCTMTSIQQDAAATCSHSVPVPSWNYMHCKPKDGITSRPRKGLYAAIPMDDTRQRGTNLASVDSLVETITALDPWVRTSVLPVELSSWATDDPSLPQIFLTAAVSMCIQKDFSDFVGTSLWFC